MANAIFSYERRDIAGTNPRATLGLGGGRGNNVEGDLGAGSCNSGSGSVPSPIWSGEPLDLSERFVQILLFEY